MYQIINKIGIVISAIGTIITLIIVFSIKISNIGTWEYYAGETSQERAKKDRKIVAIGIILIIIGTILQII